MIVFAILFAVYPGFAIEKERIVGEWELFSLEDKTTGRKQTSAKGIYCRFYGGGTFMMTNLDTRLRTMWYWELKDNKLRMHRGGNMIELSGEAKFVVIEEPTEEKEGILHLIYEFYKSTKYRDKVTGKMRIRRSGPYIWRFK